MKNLLRLLPLFCGSLLFADPLPLPSSSSGSPIEDPTNFDDYQTWSLTEWADVGPAGWTAETNPGQSADAISQGDFAAAVYYGMQAAQEAMAPAFYANMKAAMIDAGTAHHGSFDNSILVPGAYYPEGADASLVHGVSALSTSQLGTADIEPFSKIEKELAPTAGDYSSGAVGALGDSLRNLGKKQVPALAGGIAAAPAMSTVAGYTFATVTPAGMSPWIYSVTFSGGPHGITGNLVPTFRSFMVLLIGLGFAYQLTQIPKQYV